MSRSRRRLQLHIVLLAAYLLSLAAYLTLRTVAGSGLVPPDAEAVMQALLRAPLTFGRYTQWVLVPPRLSIERSSDWTALTSSDAGYLSAWLVLIAMAAATVRASRRWSILGFGVVWFAASLLPFLNLGPLSQGIAERYADLASIGLVIAVGSRTGAASAWWPSVRPVATLLVLGAGGWYTSRFATRVSEWSTEVILYEASLEATPGSHVLRYNLGVTYTATGEHGRAERLYKEAIVLHLGYGAAKVNLANLLQRRGEFRPAQHLYEEVLTTQPDRKEAILNLANLYQRTGAYAKAENTYLRALAVDPGNVEAKLNLGALW